MNRALLTQLINWPKSYITGVDLKSMVVGTDDARKSIIKNAVQAHYLERIKRDLYLIRNIANKPLVNTFELAQLVYGPSYISFESALSFHGWIPERVSVICSATIKRAYECRTSIVTFSYEKIPKQSFSVGVFQESDSGLCYLLADPWKAIADMIYSRKKDWENLNALMQDLRVGPESILSGSKDVLEILSKDYPNLRTKQVLSNILNSIDDIKEY